MDDTLVTLSDYLNKGLNSEGVLDFLLKLEARCNLFPPLSNHDAVMLGAAEGRLSVEAWKAIGWTATLQSYGDRGRVTDIPAGHVQFLRR